MIIGIGCDIIEINRVEKAVKSESFKQRVFTPAEIAFCESRGKQRPAFVWDGDVAAQRSV